MLRRLLLIVAVVWVAGCGPGWCGGCPPSLTCDEPVECFPESSDVDCPAGLACVNYECVPTGELDAPCNGDGTCDEGLTCADAGYEPPDPDVGSDGHTSTTCVERADGGTSTGALDAGPLDAGALDAGAGQ
jgi:hypothetical protein